MNHCIRMSFVAASVLFMLTSPTFAQITYWLGEQKPDGSTHYNVRVPNPVADMIKTQQFVNNGQTIKTQYAAVQQKDSTGAVRNIYQNRLLGLQNSIDQYQQLTYRDQDRYWGRKWITFSDVDAGEWRNFTSAFKRLSTNNDPNEIEATVTILESNGPAPPGRFQELSVDQLRLNNGLLTINSPGQPMQLPSRGWSGPNINSAAPIALKKFGGGHVMWFSPEGRAKIAPINRSGELDKGQIQDLGPALGGSLAVNDSRVACLLKTEKDTLQFRVLGGQTTVIMAPNGAEQRWTINGQVPFGCNDMRDPLTMGRTVVLRVGQNWLTSFDHGNLFVNPDQSTEMHYGMMTAMFNENGSNPRLAYNWGTSHSLDQRAIFDGTHIACIELGDSYPSDIRMHVLDANGNMLAQNNLFADKKYPDTQIGGDNSSPVYGVAADGGGQSSGKLGELLHNADGRYFLTYAIEPRTFGSRRSNLNEMGLLILDRNAKIVDRKRLRQGADVEFLKSSLYRNNILVAWKTKQAEDYWMMQIDLQGNVVQPPEKLPADVKFTGSDGFVSALAGEVLWSSEFSGKLRIYHLYQDVIDAQPAFPQKPFSNDQ